MRVVVHLLARHLGRRLTTGTTARTQSPATLLSRRQRSLARSASSRRPKGRSNRSKICRAALQSTTRRKPRRPTTTRATSRPSSSRVPRCSRYPTSSGTTCSRCGLLTRLFALPSLDLTPACWHSLTRPSLRARRRSRSSRSSSASRPLARRWRSRATAVRPHFSLLASFLLLLLLHLSPRLTSIRECVHSQRQCCAQASRCRSRGRWRVRGRHGGCVFCLSSTSLQETSADPSRLCTAADLVLLDDFSAIVAGIESGRLCFDNLRKAILYLLPAGSFPELMVRPFVTDEAAVAAVLW